MITLGDWLLLLVVGVGVVVLFWWAVWLVHQKPHPVLATGILVLWLLALLGDTPIPVAVSALASGRTTRVYRTDAAPVIEVDRADGYADLLAGHGIVLDAVAGSGGNGGGTGGSMELSGRCRPIG